MTSSGVTGLPSCQRASRRSVKSTHERSFGVSTVSASSPYSVKGSSALDTSSDSNIEVEPAAGVPFGMKGLKLSKLPSAARRSSPPLGASGLT